MGNGSKDIIASAGVDLTSFEAGIDRLAAKANSAESSTGKLDKSLKDTEKSSKRTGRSMQNFGFQIADVAVQAEMGTSALRILGQQGSQFLASMGPAGALGGAVLAIGAGLASWALNVKDTAKETKILAERLEETKRIIQESADAAKADERRAKLLRIQRMDSEEIAEATKRRLDLEDKIDEITNNATKSGLGIEERNRQIRAVTKVYEEEVALAQQAADKKRIAARDATDKELNDLKDKVDEEAAIERSTADQLAAARGRALIAQRKQRNNPEWKKFRKEELTALLEAAKLEKQLAKEQEQAAKEAAREQEKAIDKVAKKMKDYADRAMFWIKRGTAAAKTAAADQIELARKQAAELEKLREKAKEKLDKAIEDEMKSPAEKRKDRAEQRAKDRAARKIINRERVRQENQERGAYGQKNSRDYTSPGTEKMKADYINKQAASMQATTINAGTLVVAALKHR